MHATYRPRRQSPRWLDGDCPRGVLAIYDNGGVSKRNGSVDRYTVFYADTATDHRGGVWVSYRGMSESPSSPQGYGIGDEMRAHEVAAYRYRVRHQAARWSDLPAEVQHVVRRDLSPELAAVDPVTRDPYAYPEGYDAITDDYGRPIV
jgi:hypothetical protein